MGPPRPNFAPEAKCSRRVLGARQGGCQDARRPLTLPSEVYLLIVPTKMELGRPGSPDSCAPVGSCPEQHGPGGMLFCLLVLAGSSGRLG